MVTKFGQSKANEAYSRLIFRVADPYIFLLTIMRIQLCDNISIRIGEGQQYTDQISSGSECRFFCDKRTVKLNYFFLVSPLSHIVLLLRKMNLQRKWKYQLKVKFRKNTNCYQFKLTVSGSRKANSIWIQPDLDLQHRFLDIDIET